MAYARGQVDPDLINKSDEVVKPVLDQLRQGEQNKATDKGKSMFSLNKQADKVAEAFNNGFKKLVPAIKKSKPTFLVPVISNPVGGALHPI